MPLQACEVKGPGGVKPGWRWGRKGKCFTYNPNDERSEKRAKARAKAQASAPKQYEYGIEVKGSDG